MSRYIDATDPPPVDPADRLLDNLGRRMLKRRIDALKSLPTFPKSIVRINEALVGDGTDESFERIARIIETDPILVARVLRLVNAAFYGVSGTVVTVYDALCMLGLDIVKGIILSTNAMEMLEQQDHMHGLWEHSFGCAVAATSLARVLGLPRVEEISAAALMHDIGKVVLASQLPNDYRQVVHFAAREQVRILEAEDQLLGVGHDLIGQWLVNRWKLPASLAEPIACHHAPGRAKDHREATAVVHVADLMVRGYGFGFPGDALMPDLDEGAWRLLGLTGRKLRAAVERMHRTLQEAVVNTNLRLENR